MSDDEPISHGRISEGDRISDRSIRLVVPKRKAPESIRNIAALADDETRVEALLARLEQTADPGARSRILVEIGITMKEGSTTPSKRSMRSSRPGAAILATGTCSTTSSRSFARKTSGST